MKPLSAVRSKIYQFIRQAQSKNGYPPTVREICLGVGLSSPASVQYHLRALEEDGYLVRDPNKNRAYTPNVRQSSFAPDAVPLLGKVAACYPINAEENREDAFPVPPLLRHGTTSEDAFMVRVQGESMTGAGIHDGDILVAERGRALCGNDIVVARVHGEDVTVKRLRQDGSTVTLIPENDAFSPMTFPAAEVEIMGVVSGLMRRY